MLSKSKPSMSMPLSSPRFMKRHASFDSPAEVPLPSPSCHDSVDYFGFNSLVGTDATTTATTPPDSHQETPAFQSPTTPTLQQPPLAGGTISTRPFSHPSAGSVPVQETFPLPSPPIPMPSSRQASARSESASAAESTSKFTAEPSADVSDAGTSSGSSSSGSNVPPTQNALERMSSASLPLPMQVPYSTLPRVDDQTNASHGPICPSSFSRLSGTDRARLLSQPTAIRGGNDEIRQSSTPVILETDNNSIESSAVASSSESSLHSGDSHNSSLRSPASTMSFSGSANAAHLSFLGPNPAPPESYIEVETTPGEYRLNVSLPGFRRDGITLATKRRRILHILADSYSNEPGASNHGRGAHFERRISFGWDADLVNVRAEFDGRMLRVVVPRRPGSSASTSGYMQFSNTYNGNSRYYSANQHAPVMSSTYSLPATTSGNYTQPPSLSESSATGVDPRSLPDVARS